MGIAATLALVGISLLYMIGRAMEKREWEALARTELYQFFIALIWVFVIYTAFIGFACSTSCAVAGGNPYTVAMNYLQSTKSSLEDEVVNLLSLAKSTRWDSAVMQIVFPGTSCWSGACVTMGAGCASIADNYETIATLLIPLVGSLAVQQLALIVISAISFNILLPIGVLVRLIPGLRSTGAFLIAIAVAMYIVFPLTYVFAYKASAAASAAVISMPLPGDENAFGCEKAYPVVKALQEIGKMLPQAVFFPALSMIITIGAARVLSKVFMYDFQDFT
jgi:hypothetical protein